MIIITLNLDLFGKKTEKTEKESVVWYSSEHLTIVKATWDYRGKNTYTEAYAKINELIGQGWQVASSHLDRIQTGQAGYWHQDTFVLTKP